MIDLLAYLATALLVIGGAIQFGVGLGMMVMGVVILLYLIGNAANNAKLAREKHEQDLQRHADMAEAQK